MNMGWFSKPVPVAEGVIGDIRYVSSASSALGLLTGHWREQGTAKHKAAIRACQFAMHGDMSAENARTAFSEAADEARILVD